MAFHHCFFTLSTEDKNLCLNIGFWHWCSINSNKMCKKTYWILYFYISRTPKGFNWVFWKHDSAIIHSHMADCTQLWQNNYRLLSFFFSLCMFFYSHAESVHYSGLSLHLLISFNFPAVVKSSFTHLFLHKEKLFSEKSPDLVFWCNYIAQFLKCSLEMPQDSSLKVPKAKFWKRFHNELQRTSEHLWKKITESGKSFFPA